MKMFSIFDSKISAYLQPFFVLSNGAAIRAMTDVCNDKGHTFNLHPEDYTLFELADFDESSGQITPLNTPKPIIKVIELIQPEDM